MKKQFIKAGIIMLAGIANAQNTSPWPSTGDVGIGTLSPASRLEVAAGNMINDGLTISQANGFQNVNLFLKQTGAPSGHNYGFTSSSNGDFFLSDVTNNSIDLFVSGGNLMGIPAGNIGIGNFWAMSKLTVWAGSTADDGITVINGGSGSAVLNLSKTKSWGLQSTAIGDFAIYDNTTSTNRFFLQGSSGNIGIGNISPAEKLHVTGNIKSSGDMSAGGNMNATGNMNLTGNMIGGGYVRFSGALMPNNQAGTSGQVLQSAGAGQPPVWANGFQLSGGSANYVTKWSSATNVTTSQLYDNGSKVALGTTIPAARLSIESYENPAALGSAASSAIRISNEYANTFGARSELQFGLDQLSTGRLAVIAGEYTAWSSGVTGGDLVFGTSPGTAPATVLERMRITHAGNVYVGIKRIQANHIHANSLMEVDGKLACKELVVVDPSKWSDFVFSKEFKLKSLKDVEAYYELNKHLPDVPSEREVKENGINAAEMDATLLQKIEELTLYLVDLNKKVEQLQNENKILKTKKD